MITIINILDVGNLRYDVYNITIRNYELFRSMSFIFLELNHTPTVQCHILNWAGFAKNAIAIIRKYK